MKKKDSTVFDFLRTITITGNVLFVLWILYNGINEGFKAANIQIVAYLGLIFLLILNALLLLNSRSKK
jgi:hypothetical protein